MSVIVASSAQAVGGHIQPRASSRRVVKVPERLISIKNEDSNDSENTTSTKGKIAHQNTNKSSDSNDNMLKSRKRNAGTKSGGKVHAKQHWSKGEMKTHVNTKDNRGKQNGSDSKRKRISSSDDEAPKSKLRVSFDDNIKSVTTQKRESKSQKLSSPCGLELLLRASESLDEKLSKELWQAYPHVPRDVPSSMMGAFLQPSGLMINPPQVGVQNQQNGNQIGVHARLSSVTNASTSVALLNGCNTSGDEQNLLQYHPLQNEVINSCALAVARKHGKDALSSALNWLEMISLDAKGRLGALRRSQYRVQRVKMMFKGSGPQAGIWKNYNSSTKSVDLNDECSQRKEENHNQREGTQNQSSSGLKVMYESEVAVALFRDMELALIGESEKLQSFLNDVEEMKKKCSSDITKTPVGSDHSKAVVDCNRSIGKNVDLESGRFGELPVRGNIKPTACVPESCDGKHERLIGINEIETETKFENDNLLNKNTSRQAKTDEMSRTAAAAAFISTATLLPKANITL